MDLTNEQEEIMEILGKLSEQDANSIVAYFKDCKDAFVEKVLEEIQKLREEHCKKQLNSSFPNYDMASRIIDFEESIIKLAKAEE